jgi:hypothetical protein
MTPEQVDLIGRVQDIVGSALKTCKWTTGSSTIRDITIDNEAQQLIVDGITFPSTNSANTLGIDVSTADTLTAQLRPVCEWIEEGSRRSESLVRASSELRETEARGDFPAHPGNTVIYSHAWPQRRQPSDPSDPSNTSDPSEERGEADTSTANGLWSITLLAQRVRSYKTEWSVELFLPLYEDAAKVAKAAMARRVRGSDHGSDPDWGADSKEYDADDERGELKLVPPPDSASAQR